MGRGVDVSARLSGHLLPVEIAVNQACNVSRYDVTEQTCEVRFVMGATTKWVQVFAVQPKQGATEGVPVSVDVAIETTTAFSTPVTAGRCCHLWHVSGRGLWTSGAGASPKTPAAQTSHVSVLRGGYLSFDDAGGLIEYQKDQTETLRPGITAPIATLSCSHLGAAGARQSWSPAASVVLRTQSLLLLTIGPTNFDAAGVVNFVVRVQTTRRA